MLYLCISLSNKRIIMNAMPYFMLLLVPLLYPKCINFSKIQLLGLLQHYECWIPPSLTHALRAHQLEHDGTTDLHGLTVAMLTICLTAFVISTVLGWSYFGEKALQYPGGTCLIKPYRILWVVMVFIGCVIPKSSIVWNFADLTNGLMAIPNLICMIGLSGVLVAQTRYYV